MILVNLPLSDPRRMQWRAAMRDRKPVEVDMAGLDGSHRLRGVPIDCQHMQGPDGSRWEEWVLDDE